VVTEAAINGEAKPEFKPERQPQEKKDDDAPKADLKVINSKSA